VTGLPQEQAARELQQAGFNVGIRLQDSTGPAGLVLSQDPVGTTADRGSAVTLVVSQVPPPPPPSPTPSPTPTADPTPTPTDTPTPTPTGTPPSP
jgi:beta-lactam-binding protein with PASTA domain